MIKKINININTKIICLLIFCFIFIGWTIGCTGKKSEGAILEVTYSKNPNFVAIEGASDLYYYKATHVVYIIFDSHGGYQGYGYMAPCYSSKGNLCIYDPDTKQIIEIEK